MSAFAACCDCRFAPPGACRGVCGRPRTLARAFCAASCFDPSFRSLLGSRATKGCDQGTPAFFDRKTDRVKAVAAAADQVPSVETVGVGIVLKPSFQSDTFLALVVHSLVPGSSAEQSRMIQVTPCTSRPVPNGSPHAHSCPLRAIGSVSPRDPCAFLGFA